MAWKPAANAALGLPNVQPAVPDAVPLTLIGTVAPFVEDTQGAANLIYLPGVAGLLQGDMVVYDMTPGAQAVTRVATPGHSNTGRMIAIAINPVGAGQYGWFQLSGVAIVSAVAGVAIGIPYACATAGAVSSAVLAGSQVLGARVLSAVGTPIAGKAYMQLYDSNIQGQIT